MKICSVCKEKKSNKIKIKKAEKGNWTVAFQKENMLCLYQWMNSVYKKLCTRLPRAFDTDDFFVEFFVS